MSMPDEGGRQGRHLGSGAEQVSDDAAKILLARMRRAAEGRGDRRASRAPYGSSLAGDPRSAERTHADAEARSRRSSAGSDRRDPSLLGSVVSGLIDTRGWSSPVAVGSVISRWDQLVGAAIAEHCRPERFENGRVDVVCDSTAWATNLKLMKPQLMDVFERELGRGIVTTLDIRGPQAPTWKKGRYSVRGRGPRDTYG